MPNENPDKSVPTPDEEILVKRVDAMMDPKHPAETPKPADSAIKPITVAVKNQTTAPELPDELKEEDEAAEEPKKPDKTPTAEPVKNLEELETDKAVDDIVAKEGDMVLAVADAQTARKKKAAGPSNSWKDKLRRLVRNKWTWVSVVVLLVIVFGLPFTRYKVLGLVLKKSITITVIDSKTATPVSNAQLELAGNSVKTDANGTAHLKASVGQQNLVIKKQYYRDLTSSYFVGFKTEPSRVKLTATGRLVPITVLNKVTGKPMTGVQVRVLNTTAKTNTKGQAIIALPTKTSTNPGKLSLSGYNSADVTVQVTDKVVKANSFEITPAGHIYFLSNRSGKLDVVKANLDGSDRKTILEGTGREEPNTTSLLASRDWRYLVLKSRREGTQAALYLIDTSNDKVTQFDNGDADFSLVGWYDHAFIYSLTRNNLAYWQAGRQALKSYDAENLQLNLLDQTQAEGAAGSYAYQSFLNLYILKGAIAYNTQWYTYASDSGGKTDTIRAVQPGGQNKKDYQSFPTSSTGSIQAALYEPQSVYFSVYDNSLNKNTYYEFEDQAIKTVSLDQSAFNQTYPTFLLSPSGKQTFWTELRDGKNSLFVGDPNAQGKKQIAGLVDYSPYGWYGDGYTLVSKNSSELYIIAPGGSAPGRQPLKITDYYKPAQTYTGYGYGYGGL